MLSLQNTMKFLGMCKVQLIDILYDGGNRDVVLKFYKDIVAIQFDIHDDLHKIASYSDEFITENLKASFCADCYKFMDDYRKSNNLIRSCNEYINAFRGWD